MNRLYKINGCKNLTKTETVEVTLELPKQIADYIKDSWETDNLEETLTKEIIDLCLSHIDCDAGEEQVDPEEIVKKYGLWSTFKQYDALPSHYKEALMK